MSLYGQNLLIITHVRFWVSTAGSCARILSLIKSIQQHGVIFHLVFEGNITESEKKILSKMGINIVIACGEYPKTALQSFSESISIFRFKINRYINKKLRLLQYKLRKEEIPFKSYYKIKDFINPQMMRSVKFACQQISPDIIIVEYLRLAYVMKVVNDGAVSIIDTHDVMYLRKQAFEAYGANDCLDITKHDEAKILSKFDIIIAIQPFEADILKGMAPNAKVITCLPQILNHNNNEMSINNKPGKDILCVCAPNQVNYLGLYGFLKNSWPKIIETHPSATLSICGKISDYFKDVEFKKVKFLGFVENIEGLYRNIDIVINPVQFGGGIKIKSIEAIANGKASVFSRHGSVGIEEGEGSAFLVAGSWDEFVINVNMLLSDYNIRKQIEKHALKFYHEKIVKNDGVSKLIEEIIPLLRNTSKTSIVRSIEAK